MSMDFKLAESIEEAPEIESFAKLDDYMDELICKNKSVFGDDVDIFTKLDPYGDKLIELYEIESFIIASKALIQVDVLRYLDSINEFEHCNVEKKTFIKFANDMIKTCEFALDNNKKIVSLGD